MASNAAATHRLVVVGLGKLGTPLAAVLAAAGHEVIGLDVDQRAVDAVQRGIAPVSETGLDALLREVAPRVRATTDPSEALADADATFVIVPTPSTADGSFSVEPVIAAVRAVGAGLAGGQRPHTVVITSTVNPGDTDSVIRAALEEGAGEAVGDRIGLCYSPALIALGSVIDDLRRPDLHLLGCADPAHADRIAAILRSMTEVDAPICRMSLVEAEIAKLAINAYVTMKISFANSIGELCAAHGAHADAVTDAVGRDRRVGGAYLRAAAPYGGPCFPRDNRALQRAASAVGLDAPLAAATDRVNDRQLGRILRAIDEHGRAERVAVLGLAYKPGTGVIDASIGVAVADALDADGRHVRVHDPAVDRAGTPLSERVVFATSLAEAVDGVDAVFVATPWPEFAELAKLVSTDDGPHVVDLWGIAAWPS